MGMPRASCTYGAASTCTSWVLGSRDGHLHANDGAVRRKALVKVQLVGVGRHIAHVAAAGPARRQLRRAARLQGVAARQAIATGCEALPQAGVAIS